MGIRFTSDGTAMNEDGLCVLPYMVCQQQAGGQGRRMQAVLLWATGHHNPEDNDFNLRRCENLKKKEN
jgi:hypothetical protein